MDGGWYSWLSRTGLEPSLIYEYGLVFAHNELEEDDAAHFDHEFLQSMGISVAKHRLEILKLARKENKAAVRRRGPRPAVTRLLAAIERTRKCLAKCVQSLAAAAAARGGREEESSSAIVVVPRGSYGDGGGRWRGAMLKRGNNKRRLVILEQGRLMLTDGSAKVAAPPPPPSRSRSASPMVYDPRGTSKGGGGGGGGGDTFWGGGQVQVQIQAREMMRWDSMFQDLKPT